METNSLRSPSVLAAVQPAIEKTKRMLFEPFDLGKWFAIGFCVWLAELGRGGGGGLNLLSRMCDGRSMHGCGSSIIASIGFLGIGLLAVGAMIGLTVWVVMLWLSSRGQFMFVNCVAKNEAKVKEPWTRFKGAANNLFVFRLLITIGGFILVSAGVVAFLFGSGFLGGSAYPQMAIARILVFAGVFFVVILLSIGFLILMKFIKDFVVAIMYLQNISPVAALGQLWRVILIHKGAFTLYILFQILINLAIGAIIITAVLLTCCCAGVLIAIPYIGTVILLPLTVFKRAYSLVFLAQLGDEYDVFKSV